MDLFPRQFGAHIVDLTLTGALLYTTFRLQDGIGVQAKAWILLSRGAESTSGSFQGTADGPSSVEVRNHGVACSFEYR